MSAMSEITSAADDGTERTYTTHYAVCAPNGQPLSLFNSEGKVQWRRPIASLWGCVLGRQENAQLDPGLKFAGQQLDEESGLFYNRHRYYSPESGCYLTPDPIGLAGGMNPYAYVPNPLTWIDPLGLAGCDVTRVRHYTNRKGSNSIKESGVIKAQDNGRVYVEPANKKPLSQVQVEAKYQIKPGRGRDYIETDVPSSQL